ncbi:hypothetical protein FO519_007701 [Halicephalobus sp. NKZ332]|nr:hypothetical protein FO519_007701 [Halicephalobus sp. NKZ332]
MGEDTPRLPPSIKIQNNLTKRIKVKIDCSRSFTELIKGNSENIKIPKAPITAKSSKSHKYQVFHVVSTEESFTIIHPNEVKSFNPDGHGEEHAFLTIWIENDDKSWNVHCENHPIMKSSEIYMDLSESMDLSLSIYQGNDSTLSSYKMGKITVTNRSSKKIWVKIDADDIEETEMILDRSLEASIHGFSIFASSKYTLENTVYYRTQQGRGYTQINKNQEVNFYLNIPKNRVYISIDYKTPSGGLEKLSSNHPYRYWTEDTEYPPKIRIIESDEEIVFDIQRFEKKDQDSE